MSFQGGQVSNFPPGGESTELLSQEGSNRKHSKESKTSQSGRSVSQTGGMDVPPPDSPPELRKRSKGSRKDGTLKASSVHQEDVGGGRWSSQPSAQSTPSSGRSSRGCTPPLVSNWSPLTQSSTSRSVSPSNKSSSGSKPGLGESHRKSRGSKQGSPGAGGTDNFLDVQPSSSDCLVAPSKSLQKLHGHPSASSFSSIAGSFTSTDGKRSKRKSWMKNAINPTYRSRCEDLRRNFSGLPPSETLIVDYSCALQKDILVHGRLYVTTNFLCFYANIFGWETAVTIRWREVTAMTKEKTALVIPNAVQICTGSDRFFFTSFAARDKTHVMLFRLWQNALLDSPASQSEIWSWVEAGYGDQSSNSRYSDDPDASNDGGSSYSYDGLDASGVPPARPRLYSNIKEDEETENKMPVNVGSFLPDRAGDQPLRNGDCGEARSDQSDQSDMSDTEVSPQSKSLTSPTIVSPDILTYEVWKQNKNAREIISKTVTIDIDDLFTLLFTNSKFFYDFQAERKTFDIVQCPWQHSDKSEDKFREVSYTLNLNHAMGPKTSRATEVQTMRSNSVPGHIYNVDVETTNADIPYADSFYVVTHYCVVKVTEGESLLTVLCDIKYKKPPWGLVKSFIEKNCWAGIEEHFTALAASLEKQVEAVREEQDSKEGQGGQGSKNKKTRRQRNQQRRASCSGESSLAISAGCPGSVVGQTISRGPGVMRGSVGMPSSRSKQEVKQPTMFPLLVCMLGMLCLLNLILVYKIWGLESRLAKQTIAPVVWPRGGAEVAQVLKHQEALHHQDLVQWRKAIEAASHLLKETEQSIVRLTQESMSKDSNNQLLQNLLNLEGRNIGRFEEDSMDLKEGISNKFKFTFVNDISKKKNHKEESDNGREPSEDLVLHPSSSGEVSSTLDIVADDKKPEL